MKTWLTCILLITGILYSKVTIAEPYRERDKDYEKISLVQKPVEIRPGKSLTIAIPGGWRSVKKLLITANAYHGDATLQIKVNDDEKGRVFVPERDPYYVVTVNETASQIEIKNYLGSGTICVLSIEAEVSYFQSPPIVPISSEPLPFPALNEAAYLARRGITLVDSLRPYADPETEYIKYLLPIKTVSGRSLALANAHGSGSKKVRVALEALVQQIEFAEIYLSSALKKEIPFELATQMLSLKEKIIDWLD